MTDKTGKRQRIPADTSRTWDCSVCTYKNPCIVFRCEMCDSHKGTATRKPKFVINVLAEQFLRSKRKTNEDYLSDLSLSDDSDNRDNNNDNDEDNDDDEFQENQRRTNRSNRIRRTSNTDNNTSLSSSPKTNEHSNLSKTKKSCLYSKKSTTNNRKNLNKSQTSKSNDNNQKNKNHTPSQKQKNIKISAKSATCSRNTTIVTVDGISVQIIELLSNESNCLMTNKTLLNDTVTSHASSPQ